MCVARFSIISDQQRRGAALVEFALVAPLVFLLLLGLIVGSFGVYRYLQVAALAREASRWAAVHGADYARENAQPLRLLTISCNGSFSLALSGWIPSVAVSGYLEHQPCPVSRRGAQQRSGSGGQYRHGHGALSLDTGGFPRRHHPQ
jgi:hypothetical protein